MNRLTKCLTPSESYHAEMRQETRIMPSAQAHNFWNAHVPGGCNNPRSAGAIDDQLNYTERAADQYRGCSRTILRLRQPGCEERIDAQVVAISGIEHQR